MFKNIDIIELEANLTEFTPEIKHTNLFLLNTFKDLIILLSKIDIDNFTKILYLNKSNINQILYEEDKIVPILHECFNKNAFKAMFYLVLAIKSEKFIINYSYDNDLIKQLYNLIKDEKKELKKYISYVLINSLLDNFQELNNTEDSYLSEEFNQISELIKSYVKDQIPMLKTFQTNLFEEENIDVEDIYIDIIIFLIKNKKLEDYEYSRDILNQMDLESIELTNKMYEKIKTLFDEKYKEDYINNYKIRNLDNLINNNKIVNFYFILFRYIFKNSIYIYNIEFLLDNKKSIHDILENNYTKILEIVSLNEEKESLKYKIKFILEAFLDSNYYFSKDIFDMLKEILKFFNNFYFQSKIKEIKDIEQILLRKDKEGCYKYLSYYGEARKQNKRYNILRFINDEKNDKFTEKNFLKNIVKFWKVHEDFIHDKKSNLTKLKFRKEIFNYFTNEKNREDTLRIFKKDEIEFYIKNYTLRNNLLAIKNYYQNYFFESKKEEIDLISQNRENLDLDKYLKELELAKKRNDIYLFISKIFKIDPNARTEKEVQLKLKEWEKIEKTLEEEKFEIKDDNIIKSLFIYFNNEQNIQSRNKILREKSYKFLLKQKKEAEAIILDYYKTFFPETKKNEIQSIKNGVIQDEDLMEYSKAKNKSLRKLLIFSLLDEETKNNEEELKSATDKWEQIENDLNNKNFNNITKYDKQKIIVFFQNKEDEKNTFIKEIFNNEIINDFLNFNEKKILSKKNISSSNISKHKINKRKSVKEIIDTNKFKGEKNDNKFNNNERTSYINNIIFKNKLEILITVEKKEIKIHEIIINNKIRIDEEDFKRCQKHFAVDEESDGNKIFKFLEYFKQKVKEEYINNFQLILGLVILKKEKNYSCLFKFIPPSFPTDKIKLFKELNIIDDDLKEFLYLFNEINKEKYRKKYKNNFIKNNNVLNVPKNNPDKLNESLVEKTCIYSSGEFYKTSANKYQILCFIKIIGNHPMHTAEFVKELKNIHCYISGGTDKSFIIYSPHFQIERKVNEIKDWIYSVCESRSNSFICCSNKQLCSFTLNQKNLEFNKYELPNMTCISALEMESKVKEKKEVEKGKKNNSKKNKNKKNKQKEDFEEFEEKLVSNLIIAGRNGVICFKNMFKDGNNSSSNYQNLITDKTYRNIIQLNEDYLAFTSNSVLPGGENKLILFNLSKNKVKEEIEGYSHIASSNGMAVIDKNNKKFLLCACKKYTSKQKNGILLVIFDPNENNVSKTMFYETKEFEVYCFCPIKEPDYSGYHTINEKCDYLKDTYFFLVGGFDKKTREGKIKLYKFEMDKTNNVEYVKFMQDITIDKTEEILTRGEEEENQNKIREKFNGFKGAITSIIQSTMTKNILVSCYDGKIYLLSRPNLEYYGLYLKY